MAAPDMRDVADEQQRTRSSYHAVENPFLALVLVVMIIVIVLAGGANGVVVIGHYPEYKELAIKLGVDYFQDNEACSNDHDDWNDCWGANVGWLQKQMNRGEVFRLATNPTAIRKGTGLAREIEFLLSQGYRFYAMQRSPIEVLNEERHYGPSITEEMLLELFNKDQGNA